MDAEFYRELMVHHRRGRRYPPSAQVLDFVARLLATLFPEQGGECAGSVSELEAQFEVLRGELRGVLEPLRHELVRPPQATAQAFMERVPDLFRRLIQDAQATLAGDPAAHSEYEVIRVYPGFLALAYYRVAHELYDLQVPLLPRLVTEAAHSRTGIDIHPGAVIGPRCCIDHGTGLVIGETCVIGQDVKLYQGVTLGAMSVQKDFASLKRHPTIEDGVIIYAGATILGGDTVVGAGSVIGGNVWLTRSVPPGSRVYYHGGDEVRPARTGPEKHPLSGL